MALKRLVVVGGGFSGLACAHYAAKKGWQVDLHEASPRLGGLLGTTHLSFGLAETAANGLLGSPLVKELFADLQLPMAHRGGQGKERFIFRERPRRWPLNLSESWSLARGLCLLAISHSSITPRTHETVAQWTRRVFSPSVLDFLVAPALQGIYAGDPEQMSAKLIIGPLLQRKKGLSGGQRTLAPQEGMGQLVQTWLENLLKTDVNIQLNSTYHLNEAPQVPHILCVKASDIKGCLEGNFSDWARPLSEVQMLPLVSVTAFFPSGNSGFGCLFPRSQGFRALGVLNNHNIFTGRSRIDLTNETWIFGGALDQDIIACSDETLRESVLVDRKKWSGLNDEPVHMIIHRWPKAIPHYTVSLEQALASLKIPTNVHLCGNYLGGVGLAKILYRAHHLIESLSGEKV